MSTPTTTTTTTSSAGKHHWPPLVYLGLAVLLAVLWALGTSTQVLTSEAWMMGESMNQLSFNAFAQLWDALHGFLISVPIVPFMFGWGVQIALVIGSIGVELPKHPRWRHNLAVFIDVALIIINSCGDFASAASYGIWGQLGFATVVFFLTFVVLLFLIACLKHAWESWHA
jgi:hypothetical protein